MYKFTKEDTNLLKGVAIVLMLAHHLFDFQNRLPGNLFPISFTTIDEMDTAVYIGKFGKMCVPIFLFLSGYGMYKAYEAGRMRIIERLYAVYIKFWKVFIVFVPIGFLFFSKQRIYCDNIPVCTAFSDFRLVELVQNFTGLGQSYNYEWWFLKYYVITLLLFPTIAYIVKKKSFWANLWIIILFVITFKYMVCQIYRIQIFKGLEGSYVYGTFVKEQEPYIASFWMGCILAKDHVFERVVGKYQSLHLNTIPKGIIALIVVAITRNSVLGLELDCVIAPMVCIIMLGVLKKSKIVTACFCKLGKQSMNMWLIHPFLIYYFYECVKVALMPRYAVLVLPWVVFLSYVAGRALDGGYELVDRIRQSFVKEQLEIENAA